MSEAKPDLSGFIPKGWEGKLPPCMIQVSADGEFFHNGAPIIHPAVREMIFESVCLEDGDYLLRVNGQSCQLEVADTFYVVQSVQANDNGFMITLNDGASEGLDPSSLWIGKGDVLYCRVKSGGHRARFLRPAYYQIARHVEEGDGGFVLAHKKNRYPIAENEKKP